MTYSPRWIEDDGKMKPLISYLHVLPIEDKDLPHCAQICCWCSPTPSEDDPTIVIHNALTPAESGWVIVGEMTMPVETEDALSLPDAGMRPMTDTKRPPLWLAMDDAIEEAGQNMLTVASSAAAIRAVRDWLIQQCRNEGIDQDARNSIYGMLTAEADRAERAE